MKLSVIIVNYNVEHFLEQCLLSVRKAMHHIDGDVWVVDNNSVDGSVAMVREKFPEVKLIANKDNTGFSKANNQAMLESKAEYALLLNPDTLVEEDTFEKVIAFMDIHPDAGGLGVKMVDGKGKYLPESKRGLPTPQVSLYKITGLAALFPRSSRFARYYLGHLDSEKTHEIEILSGAFMMMRKKALDQVGLLDEEFFMYGEDIDLSYRIIQGGWKNYYYPDTRIIHYKGESTKKGSLNYVMVFYKAMVIFATKHFGAKQAKVFSGLINIAIYLRAALAIVMRVLKKLALPVLECFAIIGGLIGLRYAYGEYSGIPYENDLVNPALIIFGVLWVLILWLLGSYKKRLKRFSLSKSVMVSSAIIMVVYALLPEEWRFSRAIIALGVIWAAMITLLIRFIGGKIFPNWIPSAARKVRSIAIVGTREEAQRVHHLLEKTSIPVSHVKYVSVEESDHPAFVGDINSLSEIVQVHEIDDIVFCSADIATAKIISLMSEIKNVQCEMKIAPPASSYIIGSQNVAVSGDFLLRDINSVGLPVNRMKKRSFDSIMGFLLLLTSPILVLFVKKKGGFFKNILNSIPGICTWVGYLKVKDQQWLPTIQPSVLSIGGSHENNIGESVKKKLNTVYARDYSTRQDLKLIFKHIRHLGDTPK